MEHFYLKENFKFDFKLSKKFTKTERNFIDFFINSLEKNYKKNLELPYADFFYFFKGPKNEVFEILQGIQKKSFYYKTISNNFQIEGDFSLFSSFYFLKDKIVINFSQEFLSFFDVKSFFHLVSSKSFLQFKEKFTLNFFLLLFNEDSREKYFSLDEFKEVILTGGDYERFYDFERFIIKKLINDIETYTSFKLKYEKVKGGVGANSKIIGVRFSLYEEDKVLDEDFINSSIKKYSPKITDFKLFIKTLEELLEKFSKEEVTEFLDLASKGDCKTDFINGILYHSKVEKNPPLKTIRKNKIYSHNIMKVQSFILKELKSSSIPYNIIESLFPHPILTDILKTKIGENKVYEREDFLFTLSKESSFISFSSALYKKQIL